MSYVLPVMTSQTATPHTGNFRPPISKFGPDHQVKTSTLYATSGGRSAECVFSPDQSTLICKGIIVDVIANNHHDSPVGMSYSGPEASLILEVLSRSLTSGRRDRYLGSALARGEVYHVFRAFCVAALRNDHVREDFRRWFDRHRCLQIGGTALERLVLLNFHRRTPTSEAF
jgi:hypothetical protein